MKILSIETSCDETAVSIVGNGQQVMANVVSSQIDIHAEFGGVVPEVAARNHIKLVIPLVKEALVEANLDWKDIDAIAATQGPGLIGSLLIGFETAKALAILKNKPFIPTSHLAGHVYANWLENKAPLFPLVGLIVSGGHTILVEMKNHYQFKKLGETRDDAAGEAFDKAAAIIGLPYPGGPSISKAAEKGDAKAFSLPLIDLTPAPQRNDDGFLVAPPPSLDFSFSGLKTAVLNKRKQREKLSEQEMNDLAASFQKTLVDTLVQNSKRAIQKKNPASFLLAGGVAANKKLREDLTNMCLGAGVPFFVPDMKYCTDNAAMIGAAAYYNHGVFGYTEPKEVTATPSLPFLTA